MKVAIFANDDMTSNIIFAQLFNMSDIQITGLYIAASPRKGTSSIIGGAISLLRRMAFGYWLFLVFTNGAFKVYEFLTLVFRCSPQTGTFYSLRRAAQLRGVRYRKVADFSSPEIAAELQNSNVDLLIIRVGDILQPKILDIPHYGTWCVHSSLLPSFKGIAGEFHALRTKRAPIGSTVFEVTPSLDEGTPLGQVAIQRDETGSVFQHMVNNNIAAGKLLASMVLQAFQCSAPSFELYTPQSQLKSSYHSWPKPDELKVLHRQRKALITPGEAMRLMLAAFRWG